MPVQPITIEGIVYVWIGVHCAHRKKCGHAFHILANPHEHYFRQMILWATLEKNGWTRKNRRWYCPDCYIKYLKNLNQKKGTKK